MRIAIVDRDLCKPKKCGSQCQKICPLNRAGEECIKAGNELIRISEKLCNGCGLCVKRCPFNALKIVRIPEQLKERPLHRFGPNAFLLFRLPIPRKGEVRGILGPNGIGKTSSLQILAGKIKPNLGKEKPASSKEILAQVKGRLAPLMKKIYSKKMQISLKPQRIGLLPERWQEQASKLLRRKGRKFASKLGLTNVTLKKDPSKLSGGELQRVAIAIAASKEADIYYFDEPSSHLDIGERVKAAKLIRRLASGKAVLVAEHDLAILDLLADSVHLFYGEPGCFGVCSKPFKARVGINSFIRGFLKEENIRIHEPIQFKRRRLQEKEGEEALLRWSIIDKLRGKFKLSASSAEIRKREVIGILGPNALGKTIFAELLGGKLRPDQGKIQQIEASIKPQYIEELRKFSGSVKDLLKKVANLYSREWKSKMKPLKLESLLDRKLQNLSGGELQRVAIALCLSRSAKLYILDEPSAYLDVEQRFELARMLRRQVKHEECATAVIDHDLLFVNYLADRGLLFSGRPGIKGHASEPTSIEKSLNQFLQEVSLTFRRDEQTGRPRANKPGSRKDREQQKAGIWYES